MSALQEWMTANKPSDEMYYKGGYWAQTMFVRDSVVSLVGAGLHWDEKNGIASVISTHRSKSVDLPVYELHRRDLGLRIILRNNFYNWKLSVLSETPIEADFDGLFRTTPPVEPEYTGNQLHPVYFEGFPRDLIFGYYADSDKRRWSAEIGSDHFLMIVLFLIMRATGSVKPMTWNTRESHLRELAAEAARRKAQG